MAINSLTRKQIIIRIITIVSLVEFFIMLGFGILDYQQNLYVMAAADILFLAVFTTPLIYFFVVTPFVRARDKALALLSHQAATDSLTQLPNRRAIDRQLSKYIAHCVRHQIYGAVFLLDLDGFKQINDQYGHDAGDSVLIEIANRLRARVRSDEEAGRLGGDEFLLLVNHLDNDKATARLIANEIGEQLVNLLSQPIYFKGNKLSVGVSIGIRLFGSETISTASAIKDADIAMYRAKKAGRGQVVTF